MIKSTHNTIKGVLQGKNVLAAGCVCLMFGHLGCATLAEDHQKILEVILTDNVLEDTDKIQVEVSKFLRAGTSEEIFKFKQELRHLMESDSPRVSYNVIVIIGMMGTHGYEFIPSLKDMSLRESCASSERFYTIIPGLIYESVKKISGEEYRPFVSEEECAQIAGFDHRLR